MPKELRFYTILEACQWLGERGYGMKYPALWKQCRKKTAPLPTIRIGRERLIRESDLEAFLEVKKPRGLI
jgi:hypothetical protein